MPADGDIPAFRDASREELLRTTRQAGLAPKSDQELLPVLLDLLADVSPVDSWPGQDPRRRRRRQARGVSAAHTAGADRRGQTGTEDPSDLEAAGGTETSGWDHRVRAATEAVDAQRRRRERPSPRRPSGWRCSATGWRIAASTRGARIAVQSTSHPSGRAAWCVLASHAR